MSRPDNAAFYRRMLQIRRFEETVLDLFPRGLFYGTTHTYIGQEANAVGVLAWLREGDIVVSNHRCHGHFLAYGGSMHSLAAELMGRSTGICGGRGGSQHIQWRDFYANGILGGTIPLAAGMAFTEKIKGGDKAVLSFMGDGTLGEGVVYESLNIAALWALPILFIVENNRYAQSTPTRLNLAGEIPDRFKAFGIPVESIDSTDVVEIYEAVEPLLQYVRGNNGPAAFVVHTYRFAPHSKGDDSRDAEEIARYRKKDPLPIQAERLEEAMRRETQESVDVEVANAFKQAESDPAAEPASLTSPLGRSR
ncbi:MAG TPA: thiamine pyrophosphate-dependent dehydrogenase E1 component subunit alpha [Anaerolineales bacterium]|nr:thiamine pyrophosphate-dependent dehydrogenase E1 component subunit alpha [Anaerolineales bacterium]